MQTDLEEKQLFKIGSNKLLDFFVSYWKFYGFTKHGWHITTTCCDSKLKKDGF